MEVFIVTFDDESDGVHGVFDSYDDAMGYITDHDGTLDDYRIQMWLVGTGIN